MLVLLDIEFDMDETMSEIKCAEMTAEFMIDHKRKTYCFKGQRTSNFWKTSNGFRLDRTACSVVWSFQTLSVKSGHVIWDFELRTSQSRRAWPFYFILSTGVVENLHMTLWPGWLSMYTYFVVDLQIWQQPPQKWQCDAQNVDSFCKNSEVQWEFL